MPTGQDRIVQDSRDNPIETALAGALDWWREAGVDHAFTDAPQAWIAAPDAASPLHVEPEPVRATPQPAGIGGDSAMWPTTLAAFPDWWLTEPTMDPGPLEERVPPRGAASCPLMVLIEHPEREDRERLLSGPQGQLLDAFLAAAGVEPDQAYVASALPRCTPMPDWAALERQGLGEITRHHVALAAPQRLLLFGSTISPLLGNDPAQTTQYSHIFNHDGLTIPVLIAPSLASMLATPARKGGLWRRWLDWTG